jgi:hypothetical protein
MTKYPISNPTFYPDIIGIFNQWDRVQMLYNSQAPNLPYDGNTKLDLWDYNSVKTNAQSIKGALSSPAPAAGALYYGMPYYIGPLSKGAIDTFNTWIANSMPEGTPPAVPTIPTPPKLNTFVKLSEVLTGFDDLQSVIAGINAPANLASIYYYRLQNESKGASKSATDKSVTNLEKLLAFIESLPAKLSNARILSQLETEITTQYKTLVNDIVTLWYGGYIMKGGAPDFGPPYFSQYKYGLLWINAGAHPMGYAEYANNTLNNTPATTTTNNPPPDGKPAFYWSEKPSGELEETGLYGLNTGY